MKKAAILVVALSLIFSGCAKDTPPYTEDITFTDSATLATVPEDPTLPGTEAPTSEPLSPEAPDPEPTASRDVLPVPEKPTAPPRPSTKPSVPPTEPVSPKPVPTVPTEPAETVRPTESVPTEPAQTEQTEPTRPAACSHQWIPIQNIPAQFEIQHYVVCHCGASFPDAAAWTAHRDGFLGTEDLMQHTGYASGSSKTEIAPAMVVWQCSLCGAVKTLNAQDNP